VRNKALVEDAEACLSCNVDLNMELKRKDEDLRKVEDSRKKVEDLAEENAKKLDDSRATLLACMQEAKVAIYSAFVKGGVESSLSCPKLISLRFSRGFRRS